MGGTTVEWVRVSPKITFTGKRSTTSWCPQCQDPLLIELSMVLSKGTTLKDIDFTILSWGMLIDLIYINNRQNLLNVKFQASKFLHVF